MNRFIYWYDQYPYTWLGALRHYVWHRRTCTWPTCKSEFPKPGLIRPTVMQWYVFGFLGTAFVIAFLKGSL